MGVKNTISAEDQKWRTQQDMRTLQDYAELQADKGRLKAVQAGAAKIHKMAFGGQVKKTGGPVSRPSSTSSKKK